MRPNTNDLATATYNLSLLASRHHPRDDPRQSSGFPDVARLVGLLVWVEQEIRAAREAAAVGPGVEGGVRTLYRGSGISDIDARTYDLLLREMRGYRSGLLVEIGSLVDRATERAEKLVGRQGVGQVAQ